MGARPSLTRRLRSAAESVAAGALSTLSRWCPRSWLLALGTAAGELAYRVDRKHTRTALDNLELAFGDALSATERRHIARACWRHYGRITADAAAFHRLTPKDVGTRIRYEGLDVVRAAYAEGKGVLLISGHFGHWELTAYMQGFLSCPLLLITKPLDNPRLERALAFLRSGSGNEIVPKADAVRASLRALSRGIGVAVMIDQDARGSGVFVPFFGRLCSTIPTVGTMHLRTGAAVVATFSYPEGLDRWRITYQRLTFPGLTGDRERDVLRITAETTALLEARIRERPELWLWMHRRFKTPPPRTAA
jgi:Kdo2-lipid IVA lauroyltransferase/acyltransferase